MKTRTKMEYGLLHLSRSEPSACPGISKSDPIRASADVRSSRDTEGIV